MGRCDAMSKLDHDEKQTLANSEGLKTLGPQAFSIINESGLYYLNVTSMIQSTISMIADMISETSDSRFKGDVLDVSGPILVDFYTPWCSPCKMIAPILEEIEKEFDIKIYKLNVDENPETAERYHINGVPTLLIFKDGKVASTRVGGASRERLQAYVRDTIIIVNP